MSATWPDLVVPTPDPLVPRLMRLAADVLEPIRLRLDRPMVILSGYRSRTLNERVGGTVTSQHTRGEAADFRTSALRNAWIAIMAMVADHRLPGAGQLIYYPAGGFIHVALPSERFRRATCCVHWPEGGVEGYTIITPTLAALNAIVPRNRDPQA